MKTIILIAVASISILACNSDDKQSQETSVTGTDTSQTEAQASPGVNSINPIKEVVSSYLNLKNALANDDGKAAALAGSAVQKAIANADTASFSADQKKMFAEVNEDAIEHAEHIAANATNIEHQREHFETLSKDLYDMVKAFGTSQTLYQTHCPMYNKNKGANWLSETKEVKNPYFGSKMLTCGEVKEQIN
ncbi:MAG: DUF3347 domain-containing protein [Chitinophagaceae bacterium]|jgi:flagellar basal body rod protein FlgB|nr:MAG: DUF3347 domain-containing protein [Chitinophagaceae bacterium]